MSSFDLLSPEFLGAVGVTLGNLQARYFDRSFGDKQHEREFEELRQSINKMSEKQDVLLKQQRELQEFFDKQEYEKQTRELKELYEKQEQQQKELVQKEEFQKADVVEKERQIKELFNKQEFEKQGLFRQQEARDQETVKNMQQPREEFQREQERQREQLQNEIQFQKEREVPAPSREQESPQNREAESRANGDDVRGPDGLSWGEVSRAEQARNKIELDEMRSGQEKALAREMKGVEPLGPEAIEAKQEQLQKRFEQQTKELMEQQRDRLDRQELLYKGPPSERVQERER